MVIHDAVAVDYSPGSGLQLAAVFLHPLLEHLCGFRRQLLLDLLDQPILETIAGLALHHQIGDALQGIGATPPSRQMLSIDDRLGERSQTARIIAAVGIRDILLQERENRLSSS